MNSPESDHPDLTAYALGELGERDAARMRQMLARSPKARQEYERIQQAVSALQAYPLIPQRSLSARQRETVLNLSQIPQRLGQVIPFRRHQPEPSSPMWNATKVAAAACIAVGVFFIGQKSAPQTPAVAMSDAMTAEGEASAQPAAPVVQPRPAPVSHVLADDLLLKDFEVVVQTAPQPAPAVAVAAAVTPAPKVRLERATVAEDSEPSPPLLMAPAGPLTPAAVGQAPATPPKPVSLVGFTETAASPEAVIAFHPGMVKPEPVLFAGVILASKIEVNPKPANSGHPRRPEALPPLIIHSWKAEIASCPWDPNRRLMRFVAQIPVDQDAMDETEAEYKLVARFDPAQVQAYRLVTEKHTAPSTGGSLATRFAWYEIIPAKSFRATHEKPVAIGTVDMVQPRGAPNKNATTLKLVDRGLNWAEAREDFIFETAMVGFNELLQGMTNTGALDHKVVLDIAERTGGEDVKGERAKFIQTVKQAQAAAGL